jgi:hypothetical protein
MEDQSSTEKRFLYQQHEVNVVTMTCGMAVNKVRRQAAGCGTEQQIATWIARIGQRDNSATYLVDFCPVDSQRINNRVNADSFVVLVVLSPSIKLLSHSELSPPWINIGAVSVCYVIIALVLTVVARQVVKH